ncbi:unnamed protein product [Urochloa humidicola]
MQNPKPGESEKLLINPSHSASKHKMTVFRFGTPCRYCFFRRCLRPDFSRVIAAAPDLKMFVFVYSSGH